MPAVYIVLREQIPGVHANALEGRALSKYSSQLADLATKAGVRPLMSFFSADPDEMAGLLGEDAGEVTIPDETWFPAEDGLKTIAALLITLEKAPAPENAALITELSEFERVLEAARSHGVTWHLAIDY